MHAMEFIPPAPRTHRRHTAEFKAQAIAACLCPGVSISAVALANRLNANMLRSWVKEHRGQQSGNLPANVSAPNYARAAKDDAPPTFVPITLNVPESSAVSDIRIEICREQTVFQITWPTSQAIACAQWLREILR
jgi:transposase